jgi:hypothetical protein
VRHSQIALTVLTALWLPRTEPGAVIHDPDEVLARVVPLARRADVDTICCTAIRQAQRNWRSRPRRTPDGEHCGDELSAALGNQRPS